MELKELLDKCINDRLIDLTISGQKVKNEEDVMRVKIRPVQLKDEIKYFFSISPKLAFSFLFSSC